MFKYSYEYVSQFIAILNEHEHNLNTEQTWQLKAEVKAFSMGTNDTVCNKGEPRLQPDKEFGEEELSYYSRRAETTGNVVMGQRYFDILWEKDSKNKKWIGEGLISSSLELASSLDDGSQSEKIDSLNRALQVAVSLGKARLDLRAVASAAIRDYIEMLNKDSSLLPTLGLTDAIINFPKLFTKSDYELCLEICEKAIKQYKNTAGSFTLRGKFVERLHKLKKIIDPNDYDPKTKARDLAQTRIDEASRRTDSIMVRQHFLIEAEKILKDAGLNSEAGIIRMQVEALGKSDDYEKEFLQLEVTEKISKEVIDHLTRLFKKYKDTSALIAVSPSLMPSWSKAVESAESAEYRSITDVLMTPKMIDDNGMTIAIDTNSPERKAAMRYFQVSTGVKSHTAANLLRQLIKEKSIKLHNFKLQFSKIEHIDQDCYDSVIYGLKLFLKEDYYSASLILTTQLENFIFQMLPIMNTQQYIFENDGQTQSFKTLAMMLNNIRETIGDDLYELFNYTLVDRLNLNIRTKVAHGKTSIHSDNLLNCYMVIQLFSCLLIHVDLVSAASTKTSN